MADNRDSEDTVHNETAQKMENYHFYTLVFIQIKQRKYNMFIFEF